jgi:hypothetical protein
LQPCGALFTDADERHFRDGNYFCPNSGHRPHTKVGGFTGAMQGEGEETGPSDGGDRLTVAEIHDSISALSRADKARLVAAARAFSRLCGIEWQDLLQEAYTRALEGRRTCKRGTPIVPFLCGVMLSFVSQENDARKEGFRPKVLLRNGEPIVPDAPTDEPSPERCAISAIDHRSVLAEIEAAAATDEKVRFLIEGIYDDMRGKELEQLLGVDDKGLAAIRKRFRRMLDEISAGEVVS